MHKLVIVGGGAGGLELVTLLGRMRRLVGRKRRIAEVTLLDGNPTHIWKPLLHEVATGSLNTGKDELNYFSHSQKHHYKFRLGWMDGLDREKKVVKVAPLKLNDYAICGARDIAYDTLVLAVGSIPDTFGTKGVHEHCMFLNTPRDGELLRLRILTQALSVVYGSSPGPKLRIGIIGAGATGVELAAEIFRTMRALKIHGFNTDQLELSIVEAGPRILAGGSETLSKFASNQLKKRKIMVKTNCAIKAVTEMGFEMVDGSFAENDIRIWTAGVKAPNFLKNVGLQINRANRVKVNEFLQSVDDPDIYAMGDCGCVSVDGTDRNFLPPTAQIAHQQATWLPDYLCNKILHENVEIPPFKYYPHGMLVSLGQGSAVGTLIGKKRDYQIKGQLAKAIYLSIYRRHQTILYGWPRTAILWVGDNLLKAAMPPLKFH